jgi:hypothetical protein
MHNTSSIPNTMQWFFLILVTVWVFTSIALPILAFCLTKNAISLTFFSTLAPPVIILHRITKTLFPPGDNETKIAVAKLLSKRRVP